MLYAKDTNTSSSVRICRHFRPEHFRPDGLLNLWKHLNFGYFLFLKAFAYFYGTQIQKKMFLLISEKCIIIILAVFYQKTYSKSLAIDFRISLQTLRYKFWMTWTLRKNAQRTSRSKFHTKKCRELLAEELRKGLFYYKIVTICRPCHWNFIFVVDMWEIYYFICDVYMAYKCVVHAGASLALTLKTVSYLPITVRVRVLYNSQIKVYLTKKKWTVVLFNGMCCVYYETQCVWI